MPEDIAKAIIPPADDPKTLVIFTLLPLILVYRIALYEPT